MRTRLKVATVSIVALHKQPVPIDLLSLMSNEVSISGLIDYPDENLEMTVDLLATWRKYALIVSHVITVDDTGEAVTKAATAGAADKIVVTME